MSSKILVVDDSATNTLILSNIISDFGLTCDVATSGSEAIDLIKSRSYSIVFTDNMMPDLSGFDVAGIIRESPTDGYHDKSYYATLPFICITAEVTDDDVRLSKQCGINEIITKPISRKELQRCINFYGGINSLETDDGEEKKAERIEVYESADEKIQNLKDKLPSFDIDFALNNLGGDPDYFLEVLKVFMESAAEKKKNVVNAFEAKNYENYTVFVHGLKGDFNMIGATENASLAKFLEINGKMYTGTIPGDLSKSVCLNNIMQQTPGFLGMFDELIEEVAKAFPERFAAEKSAPDDNSADSEEAPDSELLAKLRRYISYSLDSISENDLQMANSWLNECIDIIDKAMN